MFFTSDKDKYQHEASALHKLTDEHNHIKNRVSNLARLEQDHAQEVVRRKDELAKVVKIKMELEAQMKQLDAKIKPAEKRVKELKGKLQAVRTEEALATKAKEKAAWKAYHADREKQRQDKKAKDQAELEAMRKEQAAEGG